MNKKFTTYFLLLLIVVTLTSLSWYRREHTAKSTITSEQDCDCSCPSLDELLRKEMPEASIKLEAPLKAEEKNITLSSEKNGIQEDDKKSIRILLKYNDKGTLLQRAKMYGLTTNKASSPIPYYFSLDGEGERIYFTRDESFKKFLLDIGGRKILSKAQKEIIVRLASGSHFELVGYQ